MEHSGCGSPFCHIVIPAPDLTSAKAFYEAVFGWCVRANDPGPKYWFFESGNIGGAFNAYIKPSGQSVLLVMTVGDMQAALDLVTRHGGSVIQRRGRIGEADAGYDAYFHDPNGNEMGLHSDR
ncbi:MAG: VOC family protein [Acidobacteriales bacterium]|nr:VOC family protein [Terriglobales bacterium]